jgi:hypothetical protein
VGQQPALMLCAVLPGDGGDASKLRGRFHQWGAPSQEYVPQRCVFITVVPTIKLLAWGEGDSGGQVLRETTSRCLCGLVCPRTSERVGEGKGKGVYVFITALPNYYRQNRSQRRPFCVYL